MVAVRFEDGAEELRARRWARFFTLFFLASATGALWLTSTNKYASLALVLAAVALFVVIRWMDTKRAALKPAA